MCQSPKPLWRMCTRKRVRREQENRQHQGRRKQAVLAKRLQSERLNSYQQRRNHQCDPRKIENPPQRTARRRLRLENCEYCETEHRDVERTEERRVGKE